MSFTIMYPTVCLATAGVREGVDGLQTPCALHNNLMLYHNDLFNKYNHTEDESEDGYALQCQVYSSMTSNISSSSIR